MNFFKTKTTWTNAEFIPLKLCIASIYVLVGAKFHDFFRQHYLPFLFLFLVTVVWALGMWLKKMKGGKENH